MNKADYLVNFLSQKKIHHVYGYPGGYITRLMDSLYKSNTITTHICYHEQACAFAASAYARLTGNVGVYFTTSGPGVVNGLGGLADAFFDGVPVFAIGGNVNTFEMKDDLRIRQRGFQEMDAVSMVKSVTKKAVSLRSADYFAKIARNSDDSVKNSDNSYKIVKIPDDSIRNSKDFAALLEELWADALSGRQGPVFLDFPFDIQKEEMEFDVGGNFAVSVDFAINTDKNIDENYDANTDEKNNDRNIGENFDANTALKKQILDLINSTKKPIIIAGSGVRTANAVAEIRQIAAKIPTVTSMNAVDLIADKRHKIGFIGTYGSRVANTLLAESDLVISVGARLDTRQTGMFPKNATLIRVDIDSDELAYDIAEKIAGKNVKQISVNTDAKSFLTFLSANLACENLQSESCNAENTSAKCIKKFQNRFDDVKKLQKKFDGYDRELGNLFMEEISKHILPNSVITADVGQNQVWAAQSLQIKGEHSRILIGGGYGSMGCSLPYAISGTVSDISSQNSISGGLLGNSSRIESGEENTNPIGNSHRITSDEHNTNPIGNSHQITYCIAGDGGFQMNIQELQTVVRENLPVKIFVFNNVSLGMIRVFQTELFDNRFAYTVGSGGYTVPDFCAVAKAYGIKSAKISAPSEFAGYADWFSDNEPCLFDVFLDEGTKLMPKIMFGKGGYGE